MGICNRNRLHVSCCYYNRQKWTEARCLLEYKQIYQGCCCRGNSFVPLVSKQPPNDLERGSELHLNQLSNVHFKFELQNIRSNVYFIFLMRERSIDVQMFVWASN